MPFWPMKFNLWKSLLCLALFACFDAAGDWVHVTNLNTISILDGGGLVVPAQASPYPSTNLISVPAGLVVSKVLVTLSGFTHSFPSDVSMLLVGPQGQQGILMSEVGGQNQFGVSGLTLLLDDDATTTLPVYSSLTSGVFKPTNGYLALQYPRLPYDFPQPAPVGNSNAVASLSPFKGTDPNGVWKLYVADDAGGNAGNISSGWTLHVSTAVPLNAKKYQDNLVLSWTNVVAGCTLQCAPGVAANWTNVLPAPVVVNGEYTVTNRLWGGTVLYRLVK